MPFIHSYIHIHILYIYRQCNVCSVNIHIQQTSLCLDLLFNTVHTYSCLWLVCRWPSAAPDSYIPHTEHHSASHRPYLVLLPPHLLSLIPLFHLPLTTSRLIPHTPYLTPHFSHLAVDNPPVSGLDPPKDKGPQHPTPQTTIHNT